MKDAKETIIIIFIALIIYTIGMSHVENKEYCQSHTTLIAQINEIESNQGDLYKKVQSNKDVLVSHDTHLVDMGYPACYKRVVVDDAEYYDSYGVDDYRQYR
jgi:hypothetical protein